MRMNNKFNLKSDVSRLSIYRKDGQTSLVRIESCIRAEENNLAWYIRHNTGDMLQMDI